jgi:thiol:disulfide interchange protein DsbD
VWFDQVEIPVPVVRTDTAAREIVVEASFQGCLTDGICYPPMTRTVTVAMPAGAGAVGAASAATSAVATEVAPTGEGWAGLLPALLFALLGGLVLNLMPCVLPVLSFKALGLAQASRSQRMPARMRWPTPPACWRPSPQSAPRCSPCAAPARRSAGASSCSSPGWSPRSRC